MSKKNRSPLYCKPKIIDGVDVKNIHCYSYKEILEAESKNHNPEIQYALYKYLNTYKGTDNFKIDAQKEFLKNKKFHEQKVQEKYQEWLQDDEDTKYSDAKKWYINNIAFSFAEQQSEIWLQKAIAQNNPDALYVFANRELKKLKEGKTCDINYVKELFEKAMVFGSLEAAEFLISAYLTGNDGFPKTKIRANELISVFDTNEYKFYLSEDKAYCDIEKIDKILVNNNLLCNRMVELYDQMALIKEQLDKMIKEGKTYYKGYKLRGEIGFYHEYEKKSEDEDEEYYEADCDWKLVFEDNKPLPNKIDVLGFWTNNNFGELNYPQRFICKPTHDFIYPKNKNLERCNFIPLELFEKAKPEDFCYNIYLEITKFPLPEKQINKNSYDYRHYRKYYEPKSFRRKYFWFEKKKIIKIARAMLDYEISVNETFKKMKNDFKALSEKGIEIFGKYECSDPTLNYKFCHPFGIITKKDAMRSLYVHNMMMVCCLTLGHEANETKDNYSDVWLEFFWEKPYSEYHLGFLNHSLWDHCNLGASEILKMKLKNFSPSYSFDWNFFATEEDF